ncbi:MAG TPA: hypothetical protein VMR70_04520, partial [Flavisolibacter sp.]|nr:hypothetical protein [Flavisolibacter sp.]
PNTNKNAKARFLNPYKKLPKLSYGKFYVTGNFIDGSPDVSADNWKGVIMQDGVEAEKLEAKATQAFPAEGVATQDAKQAFELVLKNAGASFKRDTLDERIVRDVKNGTGRIIDVQGGYPHGTPYAQTTIAWPVLKSLPALKDSDGDGMPDEWETKNGLNPSDASDASSKAANSYYTNIEIYINSILKNN